MSKNKKIIYGVIPLIAILILLLGYSFAYFSKRVEGTSFSLKVGSLEYIITSDDIENNKLILPPNETYTLDIELTSENEISSKYEIYYTIISPKETTNTVEGGYLEETETYPLGLIEPNQKKEIQLLFNNTGNDQVTVELGINAGLSYNDLDKLKPEQISLAQVAYRKFYEYDYSGNYETFVAETSGIYKLEAWGAQGGSSALNGGTRDVSGDSTCYSTKTGYCEGGNGAYTAGNVYLQKNEEIYIYVGEAGKDGVAKTTAVGGYNGGGGADWDHSDDEADGSGGGATDFRLKAGTWNENASLASRVMVAAGGGGGSDVYSGLPGGTLTSINTNIKGYTRSDITLATQISGNAFGIGATGKYVRSNYPMSGAGGGYYGGYAKDNGSSYQNISSGGSSYISGHTGCIAIKSETNITPKVNTYSKIVDSYHYSGLIFTDTIMKSGNEEMPAKTSSSTQKGNRGNGYAKITLITPAENNGYIIESDDLSNQQLFIEPNSSKALEIDLINTTKEDAAYELYYEVISPTNTKNEIDGGYTSTTLNKAKGSIDIEETKSISLVINNTGNDLIIVKIGAKKAETLDEIELTSQEKSLSRLAHQKYYQFDYSGSYETFIAAKDGFYQIELWGASGGQGMTNGALTNLGGKGAYTSGQIGLSNGEKMYFYVGGKGGAAADASSGGTAGYNGGGTGGNDTNYSSSGGNEPGAGGGGATDVRLVEGTWNNTSGLASRIMVAGAGGGAAYNPAGGYGGALTGGAGTKTTATPGSQTTGNAFGVGGNGLGFSGGTGAGGGGYYGGKAGQEDGNSGAGGSSYISGHVGSIAIKSASDTSPKVSAYSKIEDSYHYSGKVFNETIMKAGNEEMPTHDLTSTMTGNTGNGYARITLIYSGTYKIKYNANGGSGSMDDSEVLNNFTAKLHKNTFTKEGYAFIGWSTAPNSNKVEYKDEASIKNLAEENETVTLYAVWKEAIKVVFNPNAGNVSTTSKMVVPTLTYGSLPTPTKDGYAFLGWFTEPEGGTQVTSTTTVTATGEHTLYAQWTNVVYKVTFNANGGTGIPDAIDKTHGIATTIPSTTPTYCGYKFIGWSTSASATGGTYNVGDSFNENGNITLYAIWEADYKVIFSPSKGINLLTSWSTSKGSSSYRWGKLTEASSYTQITTDWDDHDGCAINAVSKAFDPQGYKYALVNATIGKYSNSLKIDGYSGQLANRHSGVGVLTYNGTATTANVRMSAYADAAGEGYVTLYKVVLTNCSSLDISSY